MYFLVTFVAPESDNKNEIQVCSSESCKKESNWIKSKIDDAINP